MSCRPLCFSPKPSCLHLADGHAESRPVAMARKVSEMPLFSALSSGELQHLMIGVAPRSMKRGTLLFSEGTEADRFYILLEGRVKLFALLPDGRESVVEVMHPVSSFGEAVMMLGIPFPLNAEVIKDAVLLCVQREPFLTALHHNHDLAFRMIANLSTWRARLRGEARSLRDQPSWKRVLLTLLSLTQCTTGPVTVTLPFSKEVLASRIGIRRESLSRVLASLRDYGISSQGSTFFIDDAAILRRATLGG